MLSLCEHMCIAFKRTKLPLLDVLLLCKYVTPKTF